MRATPPPDAPDGFRPHALVSLRVIQARSALQLLRREAWAWIALPAAAALGVAVGRRLHALETPDAALAFGMEVVLAAGLGWTVAGAVARADAGRTAEGPLGEQVIGGRREALWRCGQAAVLVLPICALTILGVALDSPPSALRLAAAWLTGLALVGAVLVSAGLQRWVREVQGGRSERRSSRRTRRVVATLAILGLGALAAATARRNNADPTLAAAVLGACGLGAGAVLGAVDLPLLRLLGHEPPSLPSLLARFAGGPALATAAGVAAAGGPTGLDAVTVLALAAATALVTGAQAAATVLHALAGVGRFAQAAAAVDLALLVAVAAVAAPIAPVWAVVRTAMLTVSARRRRWLEC